MNSQLQFLIKKLRKKYKDKPLANEQLNNVLWYSIPVVYPVEFPYKRIMVNSFNCYRRYRDALNYARRMSSCNAFYYCLVTLTFSNKTLDSQSETWRKKTVQYFLNKNTIDYIACIDYGKKNQREHYHAICLVEPMCLVKNDVSFGSRQTFKFYDDWSGGFHLVTLIDNCQDGAIKYAMKAVRYAFKGGGKVFHKRKPYKSKFNFEYTHNWNNLESEEDLLCGLA